MTLTALPIVALLYQCMQIGPTGLEKNGISSKKLWRYSASSPTLSKAMNSNSIVERAIHVCLEDFQETAPPPIMNT